MALNAHSVAFLAAAQRLGTSFEATLQLGRQVLGDEVSFSRALARAGVAGATVGAEPGVKRDGYADSLFGFLGASSVDSLDVSDWEGATIIHDLNQPFPQGMRQRFSAVLDAGTLEHVFEFPTALRSSLDAVRSDGHFLCITPTNNWCGHGFYQFSPETYFSFLPAAGFKIEIALVRAVHPGARWYGVPDPRVVRDRVALRGMLFPQLFYLSARRTHIVDVDNVLPQQSDYVIAWSEGVKGDHKRDLRKYIPARARGPARDLLYACRSVRRFPAFARDLRAVRLAELR